MKIQGGFSTWFLTVARVYFATYIIIYIRYFQVLFLNSFESMCLSIACTYVLLSLSLTVFSLTIP